MERRQLHWNNWVLVHPCPVVDYRDGEPTAVVRYGGASKTLQANFTPERRSKAWPDRLSICGFAARFPKGRRMWDARLVFVRDQERTEWSFWEVYLHNGPLSVEPPHIIGFLADFPARDRGFGGVGMKDALRDRAQAGLPGGPANAAEVAPWWTRMSRGRRAPAEGQ